MSDLDKNIKSLLTMRIVMFILNFLAGISFFVAYYFQNNIWYLVAGGVMIFAAFAAWIVFTVSYNKFNKIINKKDV